MNRWATFYLVFLRFFQVAVFLAASSEVFAAQEAASGVTPAPLVAEAAAIVTAEDLTVTVAPFQAGTFSFAGGELQVVPDGTWFVGVDLYRNTLIALPRLGHRGWIPVARVVAGASTITSVEQITPALPPSRIPRTLQKVRSGQPVNVVVMGSSLAEGGSTWTWSGMLFNPSSSLTNYRVPGIGTFRNIGLGGTPNQYMLAQLGYEPAIGRSTFFDDADLVVLTCLANGGEYRLPIIESVVRQLKKRGVEIILLTDNPQNPTNTYATLANTPLYSDGHEPLRVAELYGAELADTAAYVFEQHLRYSFGIFSDAIHMKGAEPAGPGIAQPSGGNEVYARAVRSVITLTSRVVSTPIKSFGFDADAQDFTSYGAASVSASSGKLKVEKTTSDTNQWGGWVDVPAVKNGDTLRIQGKWYYENGYSGGLISIGMQGGGPGWGSTVASCQPGAFDLMVTVSRDIADGARLLFFGNNDDAPQGAAFSIDDIAISKNPTVRSVDLIPDREEETLPLPRARSTTDARAPADVIVILPKNEPLLVGDKSAHGTLGPHPSGAHSFARRFFSGTGAAEDLLTLTSGQKAVMSGSSPVGFSMIRYAGSADAPVTVEVRRNTVLLFTLNLGAGHDREVYNTILTPSQYAQLTPVENDLIELTVTSGVLKICALVVLTADDGLLSPQTLDFETIPDRNFSATAASNVLALSASSSAGLSPVTFSVTSGQATINGDSLIISGAGTINVQASQAGDAIYASAIASRSFTVAKGDQTISFAPLGNLTTCSHAFELTATSTSGLPVAFSVTGPAALGADGKTLTLSGTTGTVSVRASQSGDANFLSAPDVTRTFAVLPAQTIAFPPLPARLAGSKFSLAATSSSGLPVTFAVASGPATLGADGKTLTLGASTGTVVIRATQAGGNRNGVTYAPASLERSFEVVLKAPSQTQTIAFPQPAAFSFGDGARVLKATATSGLGVTFTLVSGPATLTDNTLLPTAPGRIIVRAIQPGNATFKPAAFVTRIINVLPAAPVLPATLSRTVSGVVELDLSGVNPSNRGVTYAIKGIPAGLRLDAKTGRLTGTITAKPATYSLTAWAIAGGLRSRVSTLVLTVSPFPSAWFDKPPRAWEGFIFPVLSSQSGGSLPLGKLSLFTESTGVFNGTLVIPQSQTYAVKGRWRVAPDGLSASAIYATGTKPGAYQLLLGLL